MEQKDYFKMTWKEVGEGKVITYMVRKNKVDDEWEFC